MKMNFEKVPKPVIGVVIALILLVILSFNTNTNPNALIERILRPLHGENWVFNYAGVVVIVGIYQLLKKYYSLLPIQGLNTTLRKIVVTFMILYLAIPINANLVKIYRGMHTGVEAIWLVREDMGISYEMKADEGTSIEGQFRLENCSTREPAVFKVRLHVPKSMQNTIGQEVIELEETYRLAPGKARTIRFEQRIENDDSRIASLYNRPHSSRGSVSDFEIEIYDEQQSVFFQRKYDAQLLDHYQVYGSTAGVMGIPEVEGGIAALLHQPTPAQREMQERYLDIQSFVEEDAEEEILLLPYYVGSEIQIYEIAYENDQLVTGDLLNTYKITKDNQAIQLKVAIPCGIPRLKIVVTYNQKVGEYIIAYDGKGNRPQVETITLRQSK